MQRTPSTSLHALTARPPQRQDVDFESGLDGGGRLGKDARLVRVVAVQEHEEAGLPRHHDRPPIAAPMSA